MAEALVGWNCGNGANAASAAATPSVNVVFNDPWFGGGAGNEPLLLSYDDPTFTTPLPTAQTCALPSGWTANCRVVIHYPTHIQPLWDKDRGANTCVACHNASTAATGYLDLADGASRQQCQPGQCLPAAAESVQRHHHQSDHWSDRDHRGAWHRSSSPATLLDSHFFQVFMNDATHIGLLSPAELRLLSEWVDIGAQYYNNPFAAPPAP